MAIPPWLLLMGTMVKALALEMSTSSFVTARRGHDSRNSSLCAGSKKEGEKKVIISFKAKDCGIYQYQLQLRIMKRGV